MKKYVIGVDENDPEFRKYVAERVRLAKMPEHQISLDELKKRVNKRIKEMRQNEKLYRSV